MGSKPGSNLKSKSNSNSKWNSRSKSRSSKADTDAGAGAGADARAQTSLRPRPSRRFSANKQLQILRGLYRRLNQSSTSVGSIGGGVGGNGDDGDGARGTLGRGVDDHDKNAPTSASTAVSASASASAPRRSFDSSDMSGRTLVPSASVSTASITSIDERDADEALPEAIDILYENQSGIWWFYQPHFSTPGSTPAWMGKDFTKSNVDVKNADVPDPSWAWVWPVWYIDMSYDVDEAGWQYSLSFLARHRWHGNHPWYISFVRRRRWLRKRKQRRLIRGRFAALEPTQMFENASLCRSRSFSKFDDDDEDDDDVETSDGSQFTTTLSAITTSLKAFNTDREKEELLYDFLDSDSEELLDLPPLVSRPPPPLPSFSGMGYQLSFRRCHRSWVPLCTSGQRPGSCSTSATSSTASPPTVTMSRCRRSDRLFSSRSRWDAQSADPRNSGRIARKDDTIWLPRACLMSSTESPNARE